MEPFIQITRHPYEEPHNLQLEIVAFNGNQMGRFEFYVAAHSLEGWGMELQNFPTHTNHVCLWEIGSEHPEDRWAYYIRLRAFLNDPFGHCSLHIRFNNNRDLPSREIFEFCIPAETSAINRFGKIICNLLQLKSSVVLWTQKENMCFKTREEAKLAFADHAFDHPASTFLS